VVSTSTRGSRRDVCAKGVHPLSVGCVCASKPLVFSAVQTHGADSPSGAASCFPKSFAFHGLRSFHRLIYPQSLAAFGQQKNGNDCTLTKGQITTWLVASVIPAVRVGVIPHMKIKNQQIPAINGRSNTADSPYNHRKRLPWYQAFPVTCAMRNPSPPDLTACPQKRGTHIESITRRY